MWDVELQVFSVGDIKNFQWQTIEVSNSEKPIDAMVSTFQFLLIGPRSWVVAILPATIELICLSLPYSSSILFLFYSLLISTTCAFPLSWDPEPADPEVFEVMVENKGPEVITTPLVTFGFGTRG